MRKNINILGLNEFGDGFGHLPRTVVKVARTVPGDIVQVSLSEKHGRYVSADLEKLVRPSPLRVKSPCKAFEAGCGNCQWLHISYSEQVKAKFQLIKNLVEPLLQKTKSKSNIFEFIPVTKQDGFRNKLSLKNLGGKLAFMEEFSKTNLSPENCFVQTPALSSAWSLLRTLPCPKGILQIHLRSNNKAEIGINLHVLEIEDQITKWAIHLSKALPHIVGITAQTKNKVTLLCGNEYLVQEYENLAWSVPHHGFFQTNIEQAWNLLEAVIEACGSSYTEILDLYSGAGFFSLGLANKGFRVTGVEDNQASSTLAGENALKAGLAKLCTFIASDVAQFLLANKTGKWQCIILDPPRSGLSPQAAQALLDHGAQKLIYVSCNPLALVRDLKILCSSTYKIEHLRVLDMFPHTAHAETLVTLVR